MITEIRLAQIKDTYEGNIEILMPLVEALNEDLIPLEIILVKPACEWSEDFQVYDSLPEFEYLIKAAKLAYPIWEHQLDLTVNCSIVYSYEPSCQIKSLLESSRLRVLFSKGELTVETYAKRLSQLHGELSNLSKFSKLVNQAEVDNAY